MIKLPNGDRKIELAQQCRQQSLSCRKLAPMVREIRQQIQPAAQPTPTPTAEIKKHVAKLSRLMGGSTVPAVFHDRRKLKAVPKAARESLRQTAAALLAQIPQITRMYESLVMVLDQIAVELEE